tara:strand:+ start:119 stop:1147 length:1029 start_codon:yes stop_codon:yes gene_type:complete
MPTWSSAKAFKKKHVIDKSKTDARFVNVVEVEEVTVQQQALYTGGFADWQIKSGRFKPAAEKKKHAMYREDIEYDTWEEHYDDDGRMFYYNPATEVSQWDVPEMIAMAMEAEAEREIKRAEHAQQYEQQQYEQQQYEDYNYYDENGYLVEYQPQQQDENENDENKKVQFLTERGENENDFIEDYDVVENAPNDPEEEKEFDEDDDVARTRNRLSKMTFKPMSKVKKKWAKMKISTKVMGMVNDAGKLHDEDQILQEERTAVCSLLANRLVGEAIAVSLPVVAIKVKKKRLETLKQKEFDMRHAAHADYRQNKVQVVQEVKVGSKEYLELQEANQEEVSKRSG